jgi:hypothetical protein
LFLIGISLTGVLNSRGFSAPAPAAPGGNGHTLQQTQPLEFLIHISVDGLRGDAVARLGPEHCPHFHRLRIEGAFTENARTDFDFTTTLPNHACQLTGRAVNGPEGHGVDFNSDTGGTFEIVHGSYVAGVFDVTHDHGLRTAMYASKGKFDFYERSWNGVNGAADTTGVDNGRDKIDTYLSLANTAALIDSCIAGMSANPYQYCFIHLSDPDAVGHASGWESMDYFFAVMRMDSLLGRVLELIDDHPLFTGKTGIIVTADHGGVDNGHSDPTDPNNYTVPFYAWGPAAPAGGDLYLLNPASRLDPDTGRPGYEAIPQPIRHADVANLALELLGLGPIPESTINASQDLQVTLPADDLPTVTITNPADGALFDAIATIGIEADASSTAGGIDRVEFFADWIKLGEDSTSPYSIVWSNVPIGTFTLAARAVDNGGGASTDLITIEVISATAAEERTDPQHLTSRIYPNPFSGSTSIEFSLPRSAHVEITVYDILGRRIETILSERRGPGRHTMPFRPQHLSPGLYFYILRTGTATQTGKLIRYR